MGGRVSRAKSYLVGEHGPEMFTPSVSGSITPNHKLGHGEVVAVMGWCSHLCSRSISMVSPLTRKE